MDRRRDHATMARQKLRQIRVFDPAESQLGEELRSVNAKRPRQPQDHEQRRNVLSPLDEADVISSEAGEFRERLLSESAGGADSAKSRAKSGAYLAPLLTTRHSCTLAMDRITLHRTMARKATRLENFLLDHKLTPIEVANTGACSRQQLFRLRVGACNPRLVTMLALKNACSSLVGRKITVSELFEVNGR
jgi:hypothetical protein